MRTENTGKGKAPYIPLYADDFLTDSIVEEMDCAECGIYIRLLLTAWHNANKNETPPTLLKDTLYLAGAGRTSEKGITVFFSKYPNLWNETVDGRRIFQKRELREYTQMIQKAIATQEKALEAVRKRHGADANTDDIEETLKRLRLTLSKCNLMFNQLVNQLSVQVIPQLLPEQSTDNRVQSNNKNNNNLLGKEDEELPQTHNEQKEQAVESEQLTLDGNTANSARLFNADDFVKLWNEWKTRNSLETVEAVQRLTAKRKKNFNARQKAFSKDGANTREFWARLLSIAIQRNNGWYIGNGEHNGTFKAMTFDWLLKDDTNIVKFLEAQSTEGGIEYEVV